MKNRFVKSLVAIFGGFVAFVVIGPAFGDVAGKACVIDAQTISISAKRQHEDCNGGTRVRLYGVSSPGVKQVCKAKDGRDFFCGRYAAKKLLDWVLEKQVYCKGNATNAKGELVAICRVAGEDLGEKLVRLGLVFAYLEQSMKYEALQAQAEKERLGLWDMTVEDPITWRENQQKK